MKSPTALLQELQRIPGALLPSPENPEQHQPPRILLPTQDPSSLPWVDVNDGPLPSWVEQEVFSRLDRALSGDQPDSEGRVAIDALAWYVSFHHAEHRYGKVVPGKWGIYIRASSLAYLESRIFSDLPVPRSEKWQFAMRFLLAHEYIHFALDCICANWEILLKAPCWASLRERVRLSPEPYLQIEELLANAHMLRSFRKTLPVQQRKKVDAFVASQPPGYRDAPAAITDDLFDAALTETIHSYIGIFALERGLDCRAESFKFFQHLPSIKELASNCPVYLIPDQKLLGLPEDALRLISRIPLEALIETPSFQKDLKKLDQSLQRAWHKLKQQMNVAIPSSADFKKFKGAFSVRLNDNFRVHLRMTDEGFWEAFKAGSHKKMGHG